MRLSPALAAAALLAWPLAVRAEALPSPTLAAVRAAGHLDCGVVQAVDDWNSEDVHGDLSALEGEVCRAVAAAVLGDAEAASVHAFAGELEALGALKAGAIQLAVGLSPTTTAAVQFGVAFGRPVFYDSQRVMVAKQTGIHDLAGLRDVLICAMDLRPPEQTLHDELGARGIPYALMTHSEQGEMDAAVAVRRCAAGTGMETRLAQSRANFHARVSDFAFLPDRWALSPMVVATRYGDPLFSLAANDTVDALVEAEALGITQANVAEAGRREDLRAGQLLGHDFATAQALGLDHAWAVHAIAAVGNYGEVFDRAAGRPYHLERGLNALWTEGGLMAPNPMR
jgi:general L-amino acid transport system substrate-binding protein